MATLAELRALAGQVSDAQSAENAAMDAKLRDFFEAKLELNKFIARVLAQVNDDLSSAINVDAYIVTQAQVFTTLANAYNAAKAALTT